MTVRTGAAAVAYARRYTRATEGECLKYVRTWLNVPAKYGTARLAEQHAVRVHVVTNSATIPLGVPVFYDLPSDSDWHVALSVGNGKVRSTDYPHGGLVSEVDAVLLGKLWGATRIWWSEDLNGVKVYYPAPAPKPAPKPAPGKPSVSLRYVKPGATNSEVKEVQKALGMPTKYQTGYYGPITESYVKAFQLRNFGAKGADGVIGAQSLAKLGFTVVA